MSGSCCVPVRAEAPPGLVALCERRRFEAERLTIRSKLAAIRHPLPLHMQPAGEF